MNQSCTNHEHFMKLHEQFIEVLEVMNSTLQGRFDCALFFNWAWDTSFADIFLLKSRFPELPFISSPELKAQVSFSDRPLSGVRPSVNFYIFYFFSRTTEPLAHIILG
jgi:hypothetical protein